MTKNVRAQSIFPQLSFQEFGTHLKHTFQDSCKLLTQSIYCPPVTFKTFIGQSLLKNSKVNYDLHANSFFSIVDPSRSFKMSSHLRDYEKEGEDDERQRASSVCDDTNDSTRFENLSHKLQRYSLQYISTLSHLSKLRIR